MKFGKHIKAARKYKKLNQADAAAKLGISARYLAIVEIDKQTPPTDLLNRIRKLTGVNVYALAWRDSQKAQKTQPAQAEKASEK